jgi:hypothetical protein
MVSVWKLRSFGLIRSHLQESRMQKGGMGPIGFPEMSAKNYLYLLCNNPEESSSHLLRGGSLKSRFFLSSLQRDANRIKIHVGLIKIKVLRIYFPMSSTISNRYFEKCPCLAKQYDMTPFKKPVDSVQLRNKFRDAEFFLQGKTVTLHINNMLQFTPRYPKWSLPNI